MKQFFNLFYHLFIYFYFGPSVAGLLWPFTPSHPVLVVIFQTGERRPSLIFVIRLSLIDPGTVNHSARRRGRTAERPSQPHLPPSSSLLFLPPTPPTTPFHDRGRHRKLNASGRSVGTNKTGLPRPHPDATIAPADWSWYLRVLQPCWIRDVSPLDAAWRLLPLFPQPQRQEQPGE